MSEKNYPAWICAECGRRRGHAIPGHCATFHEPDPNDVHDHCGWCGSNTVALTEPSDYGYPKAPPTASDAEGQEKQP